MRSNVILATAVVLAVAGRLAAQHREEMERPPEKAELAAAEVVAPFELVKGRPVVQVGIGGKGPFPFVLDTGAGGTVIEAELARELALPVFGETRIGDPIQPHGIAAKRVRMERISIGGAAFSGVPATAMEKAGFSEHLGARGVLGMPVFRNLLLTIDNGRGEIRIARGELPEPDGKEVLSYRQVFGGTFQIPIRVGPLELGADLDSGSPAGLSLPNDYMEKLPLEGKPVEVGRARTVSSEFVVHGATLSGALAIGGFRIEKPDLRFNALPVANIGNEILRRFALTIDQQNRRVRFREVEHAAPSGGAAAPATPSGA